jgi:uncharacterized FlaG/YvyC family protein
MPTKQDKQKDNGKGEAVVEETAAEESAGEEKDSGKKVSEAVDTASKTINEAFKQVEKQVGSISKALGSALQDRANVVMVRVNDDSLQYLDMMVEADITKSRSESAAFLINEGIKANESLFNKIREITDQIAALRAQLRETVKVEE